MIPKKKQLFAFFEGDEDIALYRHLIENAMGHDWILEDIVVGCKNDVLKLHDAFDWNEYNPNQICFFVDRDLSYWLGEGMVHYENIYVTDEYSVENYIVNRNIFYVLIKTYLGFARATKEEIDNMINKYEDCQQKFEEQMVGVMACAIVAKRRDESSKLDDFKISKIVKIDYAESHIVVELDYNDETCKKWNVVAEDEDVKKQIEFIENNMEHYSVRGKWNLFFMVRIGEFMRVHASIFAPSLGCDVTSKTCDIFPTRSFTALAPNQKKIPESLEVFKKRHIKHMQIITRTARMCSVNGYSF